MTKRQALDADEPRLIRSYRRSELGFSTAGATELCFEKKKKNHPETEGTERGI